MRKKILTLLATGVFAVLPLSCGDTSVEEESNSLVNSKATLRVSAKDAFDESLAAKATLLSTGESKDIPASGTAVFGDVPTGEHQVLVKKDGYAEARLTTTIKNDLDVSVLIARENVAVAKLYELSAGLEGYLYYANANGKYVPAKDVTVRVTFGSSFNFVKTAYDVTTDADGKYVFEGLPAVGLGYTVASLETSIDGVNLPGLTLTSNSPHALMKGMVAKMGKTNLSATKSQFFVSDYPGNVSEANADKMLTFQFSDAINPESVSSGNTNPFAIITTTGFTVPAYDVEWGETSVNIKPAGKWPSATLTVTFRNDFKSVKGKVLSPLTYVIPVGKADISAKKVGNLKLTSEVSRTTTYASLQWDTLETATAYDVYVSKKGTGDWQAATAQTAQSEDSEEGIITATYYFVNSSTEIGKDTYTFAVQAKNDGFKSLLAIIDVTTTTLCLNVYYDPETEFCQAVTNEVKDLCGGETYTVSQFCQSGTDEVKNLCGGETYTAAQECCGSSKYTLATQFCYGTNNVVSFCGTRTEEYDPDKYECGTANPSWIYLKNGVSDGTNDYKAVLIGTQTWMAENLAFATDGSQCYLSDCTTYGSVYDWTTAINVCPSGWHLPSLAEWGALKDYVESDQSCSRCDAMHLKATYGWNYSGNGVDTYGFSALPGGFGSTSSSFGDVGSYGHWWSISSTHYWSYSTSRSSYDDNYDFDNRLVSVRCVKD